VPDAQKRHAIRRLTGKLALYAVRIERIQGGRVVGINDVNDIVADVPLPLQLLRIVLGVRQHRAHVIHNFVTGVNRVVALLARHVS